MSTFSQAARRLLEFAEGRTGGGFYVGGGEEAIPALAELASLGLCGQPIAAPHRGNPDWKYAALLTADGYSVADRIYA